MNQFANPANPLAHEMTTGPEILRQMDGDVDAIVVGVGSGGTLTGIGRFMRQASPETAMILADPEGSVLAPYIATGQMIEAGSWAVEGIGEDFVPPNADLSLVSKALPFPMPRALRRRASCCAWRGCSPAPPRARCWRRRYAIAASSRPRKGW